MIMSNNAVKLSSVWASLERSTALCPCVTLGSTPLTDLLIRNGFMSSDRAEDFLSNIAFKQ